MASRGDDARDSLSREDSAEPRLPEGNMEGAGQAPSDALPGGDKSEEHLNQANAAKAEGNALFGEGKYEEALECYANALNLAAENSTAGDLRSMCHSNRAICFIKLTQFEAAVTDSTKALQLNPSYLKALTRRALAYEMLERFDEALGDLKKIVELDPANRQVQDTIRRLTPIADAKREKMKDEMIGKLKELGNSLLGRFGMSLDNFNAVKDPVTGSYSISMQR